MKLFGREPALWTAAITSVLAVVGSLGLDVVSPGAAFAVAGVANALVAIATVRPMAPALFTGLFTAVVALLAEYQLNVNDGVVTTVSTAIVAVFTLAMRAQVSPAGTAWQTGVLGDKVTTAPNSAASRR